MCDIKNIRKNFKGIVDTTLREGFQFFKADFNLEQQKKIFNYLNRIGVDYIELGNPANPKLKQIIKSLLKEKKKSKVLVHIRNRTEDLKAALDLEINGLNILCTADRERLKSMHYNLEKYTEELQKNILLAKKNHLEVRVSVEDSFHQSFSDLLKIDKIAEKYQVERIGLADTLGSAMNWEIDYKVRKLREYFDCDIEVHFHNDLGQAVTNSLWALNAGANWIDTTLLGIGERTGIVALSIFLANLYVINPQMTKKYNLELLTEAENYIAKICRIETPFNLITNKLNGFAHKAGIHLNALIKHGPKKYELFAPQVIGNSRTLICDSNISGRTTKKEVKEFYKLYGQ